MICSYWFLHPQLGGSPIYTVCSCLQYTQAPMKAVMHFGYKQPPKDTAYVFELNSPLPDNRAWRVCTPRSMAALWLHAHCTPSLLWSSSSCSAKGRWGALPTLPFPAPPPLPGLLQGALSGDKTKPHKTAITYLFNWCLFHPNDDSCKTECRPLSLLVC